MTDYWNQPLAVPDGKDYFGIVESAESRAAGQSGYEFFEFKVTVTEGEYTGMEAKGSVMVKGPDGQNEQGIKTLKTYGQRLGLPTINDLGVVSVSPTEFMTQLENALPGASVTFDKRTDEKGREYVYLHDFNVAPAPVAAIAY